MCETTIFTYIYLTFTSHLPTFTSHLPHIYLAFPHLSALVQALLGASHKMRRFDRHFALGLAGLDGPRQCDLRLPTRYAGLWVPWARRRSVARGTVGIGIGQLMEVSSSPWAPKFASEGFCERGNPNEKWMMTNVWGTPHFWKAPYGDGDPKKNSSIAGKSLI